MIFTDTAGKSYPVHTDGSGTKSYFYYRSLTAEEQVKYEQGTLTGYEEVAEFTNLLVNGKYYLKETMVPDGYNAVSYTHLDVYKRQIQIRVVHSFPPCNHFYPSLGLVLW